MDEGSALPRRRASDDDSGGATTLTSAPLARYLDRVESLIGRDAVGALNASRQAMRVADRSGVKGDRLAALLAVGRALNDSERFAEAVEPLRAATAPRPSTAPRALPAGRRAGQRAGRRR